ncbi:MAG: hypothetical protein KIS92_08400 [Planctomycetota bacterium]|nr:hypothetical protein [Planctomycetota bacterium]
MTMRTRRLPSGALLPALAWALAWTAAAAEMYQAPLDVRAEGEAKFVRPPSVEGSGKNRTIKFELSAATDVEVAILDANGKVVRHLGAGLLGKNAPAPFAKNALAQALAWDGTDDAGQPVAGPCKVRVAAGSKPVLDRIAGWNGNNLVGIVGLVVGKDGELFVMSSEAYRGATDVCVLDRAGKYQRTIIPYPANTPPERLATVGQIDLGKEKLPVVLNAVARTFYPLLNGMHHQNMVWHPNGYLVMTSGLGTLSEHGPPRHLLALHPEGGAPVGVPFVGPRIRKPIGFMGGSGEASAGLFEHLAVSLDGAYIYQSVGPFSRQDAKGHGVLRISWTDAEPGAFFFGKAEAGAGDEHLNTPEGLATDAKGNLYICDWGNNRVVIVSPEGKRLGSFDVAQPLQIAVHPATGEIYTFSAPSKKSWMRQYDAKAVIRKFGAWGSAPPKELARFETTANLMALDASASPARLWVAGSGLIPLTDRGDRFEAGASVLSAKGLECPWFVSGDPERQSALVYERNTMGGKPTVFKVDFASGAKTSFCEGTNLALDRDGNAYIMGGRDSTIYRYDPSGKPLPFSGTGTHKIVTKGYRGFGPNLGILGIAVSPAGNIYVMRTSNYGKADMYGGRIDVYGPDGKLKKENLIDGLGYGDCCLGVDAAENVYVGSNLKLPGKPYPDDFMGKLPDAGWTWWKGKERAAPWCYPHLNTYLFYWGSVFKFGPQGGTFYGQHPWVLKEKDYGPPKPPDVLANAPADAVPYRSSYLGYEVKVAGALWSFHGLGSIPGSGDGLSPDPGCICHNSRMEVDPYGRVFAPDVFRFCVEMLDTNGNLIARIGKYGNADSAGPGSKVPEPAIAFAWPGFVSANQGKVMVSDPVNKRIVVVGFSYQAEATVAAP